MKLLVISGLPWNNDNSFGSTFSSFFEGMDNVEFLNIYCGYGLPRNHIKGAYIQITELSLLKNLLNPHKNKVFRFFSESTDLCSKDQEAPQTEKNKIDGLRKYNSRLIFWLRCFIWKIGRWRNEEVTKIIRDYKPDMVFSPLYYNPYLNDLTRYASKITGVPVGVFVSDDIYSLHQFSLSPFFWIERLMIRPNIKKTISMAELCYTITEEQKREYEGIFHKSFMLLTKGDEFSSEMVSWSPQKPIKILFTGAVYGGRFNSIKLLMEAIDQFNEETDKIDLYIYSNSCLSKKEQNALSKHKYTHWMGGVSGERVRELQLEADVLLHVESLRLSERRKVRHSFSTKLVEYFKSGKCILAIGKMDCASISYLSNHSCGYVAGNIQEITHFLDLVCNNSHALEQYIIGAMECGKINHSKELIQNQLKSQLEMVAGTRN